MNKYYSGASSLTVNEDLSLNYEISLPQRYSALNQNLQVHYVRHELSLAICRDTLYNLFHYLTRPEEYI